jgi:hypothetical protein
VKPATSTDPPHCQNVNIVYVGTMNVSHYEDAKLALEGGKHCLLEKVCPSPANTGFCELFLGMVLIPHSPPRSTRPNGNTSSVSPRPKKSS